MNDANKYIPLDQIDQGGEAIIFKVKHSEFGYVRALRQLYGNPPVTDKSDPIYQKFVEECKTLLRIGNGSHPNIIKISQPILYGTNPAVEMELLIGRDVYKELFAEKYFSASKTIALLKDISYALAYCHYDIYKYCMSKAEDKDDVIHDGLRNTAKRGAETRLANKYKVIHNDIQSKNIFLNEDGRFILLDFGLAFENGQVHRRSSVHKAGVNQYKAPEKFDDKFLPSEQSDIYSLGILLYECLAGEPPFDVPKNTAPEKAWGLFRHIHKDSPVPDLWEKRKQQFKANKKEIPNEKDYPQWLEDIILKCLEKDPKNRFQNGKELHNHVLECVERQNKFDQDRIEEKTKEIERQSFEVEIESKNKEIEGLKNKIDRGFEPERVIFEEKIKKQNDIISQKETEISNSKILLDHTIETISKLNVQINEANDLIIDKENELKKVKELEKEVIDIKKDLSSTNTAKKKLDEKVVELLKDIGKIEDDLEREKRNVKTVTVEVPVLPTEAQKEIQTLKGKITQQVIIVGLIATLCGGGFGWLLKGNKTPEQSDTTVADTTAAAIDTAVALAADTVAAVDTTYSEPIKQYTQTQAENKIVEFEKMLAETANYPNKTVLETIVREYPELKPRVIAMFRKKIRTLNANGLNADEYESKLKTIESW